MKAIAHFVLWSLVPVMALCRPHRSDGANTDPDAGNWQMIALTGPTQFTVAARGRPAASTTRRS